MIRAICFDLDGTLVDSFADIAGALDDALAWLLGKPAVTSVIFGARTVEQVDDNLVAGDLRLGAEHMKLLDEASAFELGYPYDFMARIQNHW